MAYTSDKEVVNERNNGAGSNGTDTMKHPVEYSEYAEAPRAASVPQVQLEPKLSVMSAPPLVQAMTPEQRREIEAKLLRKIDWRLLPMLVIM